MIWSWDHICDKLEWSVVRVVLGEIYYIWSNSNKLEVNEIIQEEGISRKEEPYEELLLFELLETEQSLG